MIQKIHKILILITIIIIGINVAWYLRYKHSHVVITMDALSQKENIVPIVVIGSGCAGYSAALYGARGGVKTIVISGSQPGGQLSSTTKVENWPGLSGGQLGPDIMQKLQKQCEHFGAEILYDSVKDINLTQWPYTITTLEGKTVNALTVIIATGASPSKLEIPGEDQYWGRGVTTCAICDAPFHKGKNVIVIGGGDSAVEEALQLSSYAKKVTIVVRKDHMRASPSMQNRLKDVPNVSILYNTEVHAIKGNDDDGVTNVDLYNNTTKQTQNMMVSGVFLAIGHIPNSNLFTNSIAIDKEGYIITQGRTQETTMPGIFAAGDVEDKMYRQAGVAAGSGIKSALDALNFLQKYGFTATLAKKLEQQYFKLTSAKSIMKSKPALRTVKNVAEFDTLRKEKPIMLVDFYTTFCPSCSYLLPTLELVAEQFADKIFCIKVNADEVPELSRRYKISSVPTLILFKDGEIVDQSIGALSEVELVQFIEQVL